MQFFLYEVVARIVSAYLCVVCYRTLRDGLAERKITSYSSDLIDCDSSSVYGPVDLGCSQRHRAGSVLDPYGRSGIGLGRMLRCCDIWVVASNHLNALLIA